MSRESAIVVNNLIWFVSVSKMEKFRKNNQLSHEIQEMGNFLKHEAENQKIKKKKFNLC